MRPYSKPSGNSSSSRGKASVDLDAIAESLTSRNPAIVESAVRGMKARLGGLSGADYRRGVETLCSLFYVDTADRPDLEASLERATAILASQGAKVVPILLSQMQASDIKSHIYLARTLGRIGKAAIPSLRDLLATSDDAYARAFALYALGKMTCPDVARALPEAIGGLMYPDKEVRDTAARTLGRFASIIPPRRLTPRRRREMFEALVRASHDLQPPVRAKAVRSLGKMASAGVLNRKQCADLIGLCRGALGESDEYVWDHAYIVRREAKEALDAALAR